MKSSIIPIFLPHLGFLNDCVFCNQRAIAAERPPEPGQIGGIVSAALKYARNPQIAYYGGSFTALAEELQNRYLAAAFEFVRRGECDSIRVSTRPDCIDARTVERLKKYGVRTVELGAQSMTDTVLVRSRRGHTADDTVRAAHAVKSAGMELVLQMMTGLPGSTHKLDVSAARALAGLEPDGARIYPACVVRGSELEHMFLRGQYTPQTLEQATECAAECLEIFESHDIPVLRIGLNPTDELSGGGIVAGPYHPAMGELARSRRLRNLACAGLSALPAGRAVLSVPEGRAPLMRGQRRCNMLFFERHYPHIDVEVRETAGQREAVLVSGQARMPW